MVEWQRNQVLQVGLVETPLRGHVEYFWHVTAIVGAVIGATWALRTKLGDIEAALYTHVAKHEALEARVIKIEDARKARRDRQ